MNRDIDLVVALSEAAIPALAAAFERDFYLDTDGAREAVRLERMFNLMHLESGIANTVRSSSLVDSGSGSATSTHGSSVTRI